VDVVAGLTVCSGGLGYAGIAGVPLQNGLYAAAAGAIIYAVFCTSRQISTGPSSALAAVAGSAVIASGVVGDQDATVLVAGVALVAGVLFLLMAIFKLGWISQFLSKAVITGFLFGAAIDVTVGELPKLTGPRPTGRASGGSSVMDQGLGLRNHAAEDVSLVMLFGLRLSRRGPRTLVVAGGIASSCSTSAPAASPSSARCPVPVPASRPDTLWANAATVNSRGDIVRSASRRPPATPATSPASTAIASTSTRRPLRREWRTSAPG
jgi:hypothetical protein